MGKSVFDLPILSKSKINLKQTIQRKETMLTIQHLLSRNARFRPNHLAIICNDIRLTYKEFDAAVNQLANAMLAAGITKGSKVSTLLNNCYELYEIYWACAKIGAVCVPNSPMLRGNGLVNLLNDADTELVITSKSLTPYIEEVKAALNPMQFWVTDSTDTAGFDYYYTKKEKEATTEPIVELVSEADPYNIMYSSGTTGLPKGIVISHQVRALYGALFANYFRMMPESVVMHSGSIVFNGSFLTLLPVMFVGGTYILLDHFDAHAVTETIKNEKVTHTILVPSQIVSCLNTPEFTQENLQSLEYILSVGAPLLLEHKEELDRRTPGIFYELYGLTEGFMTILDKTDFRKKAGSVGCVPQFMDIKIIDDEGNELPNGSIGEIVGSSPLLMTEYYKNPEKTTEAIQNGWLHTGDVGYLDDEGYLFLTGRKKDLIISGGVNVYPIDIEEIIAHHPAVKDVAVFGVPHNDWGETPVAAVILKESVTVTTSELKTFANDRLEARYQKVTDVIIVPDFPKNVAGKILKRELRDNYSTNS